MEVTLVNLMEKSLNLRKEASHNIRYSFREWPHHALQSRRYASECIHEAKEIEDSLIPLYIEEVSRISGTSMSDEECRTQIVSGVSASEYCSRLSKNT